MTKYPLSTTQDERTQEILQYCIEAKTTQEIMNFIGINNRKHFRESILKPLIEKKLLALTIPDKPNSPKQKYIVKRVS